MKLEIIVLDKPAQKFKQPVVKYACRLTRLLRKRGIAEVYLIGSSRMKGLNKRFRGKDKTTTVLSFVNPKEFPPSLFPGKSEGLGEVYLDPVYIQKKHQDLSLMLVHGVLHIMGYGHKKKCDRIKMQKKEAQLLSKLNPRDSRY